MACLITGGGMLLLKLILQIKHMNSMKNTFGILMIIAGVASTGAQAQTASFNFTAAAVSVTGWTNVAGDPSKAVRTATAPSGITVSSVATANWYPDPTGNACAYNGGGSTTTGFFPGTVLANHWYVYGTTSAATFNVSQPQVILGGLQTDSIYTLRLSGSFIDGIPATYNLDPILYTVTGATNYGTIGINGDFNSTDGAVINGVVPESTGKIRIYLLTANGSNVASLCGLQISTGVPTAATLTLGPGVAQLGGAIALGDSVTGPGPHSFASNRYQYLNGHLYSIGGSVNDPVNHPVFRAYSNGDLSAGAYDYGYYCQYGEPNRGALLCQTQLPGDRCASDRVDTTQSPIAYGIWPTSGIIINSDEPNTIKGKIMNTVFVSDESTIDSGIWMENNFIAGERLHFAGSTNTYIRSFMAGFGNTFGAPVDACVIDGQGLNISKIVNMDLIMGYQNSTQDTSYASLVGGAVNQFGGLDQLVSGQGLVNRTPMGTILGNFNVDFSSLSYTGTQGAGVSGLAGYPLFALGNASGNSGAVHSNALTVLYNGRTQINTSGFSNSLTQANVTPQAALDVVSTNTGVLLPRLSTSQRNAIVSGDLQNGLLLYNTDSSYFQYYNGSAWNAVGGSGSSHWSFSSGSVYDSVDNVALGTSNPQGYKLAVNGNAIFTRVVVKPLANWPDYVFEKGYVLPDLTELERLVHQYHHLPGIASERDIRQEGMDVGEQQAALLKKVEELTLYLIRENKSLNEENKQIVEEQKRISAQNDQLREQNSRLEAQQRQIDELKAMILKKSK